MPEPPATITTPHDLRLVRAGRDEVAGADQTASMLRAAPDERLESLTPALDFIEEARLALRRSR